MSIVKLFRAASAALAVLALAAPAAHAAPADVTLEVAGANGVVLPQTAVRTTTTPVVKDGNPAHACSGTSAGGALQVATAGDWQSESYLGGYSVTTIKGESHPFSSNTYWGFYVNGKYQESGACGTELQQGDRVQFFAQCAGAARGCYAGEPIQLTAPARVKPGVPFSVAVTKSTSSGLYPAPGPATTTLTPASGATVGGTTTGGDGKATLTLKARGPQRVAATLGADRPPSAAVVCVTDGSDGYCGTDACVHTGNDGRCGTPDRTPSRGRITGIAQHQVFTAARAPRVLRGVTTADPSGLKDIRIRLARSVGPRSSGFDARRERFVPLPRYGAAGAAFFSVGDRERWSYLLPERLTPGRYVLDVRVTDRAGNVDAAVIPGRNRVVFTVR